VKDAANDFSIISAFKDKKLSRNKSVVIMDEVDGMSGNADRGGMQELINIIKSAHVPIICLCNDRKGLSLKIML
jgi:replication factor C subunit 1